MTTPISGTWASDGRKIMAAIKAKQYAELHAAVERWRTQRIKLHMRDIENDYKAAIAAKRR